MPVEIRHSSRRLAHDGVTYDPRVNFTRRAPAVDDARRPFHGHSGAVVGCAICSVRLLDAPGLRAIAALLDRPIHAIDVGCRDGIRPQWRALGPHGSLVGFEADPEECARLNARAVAGEERYEPIALAASSGHATLHLTADPQSASLYPPNQEAVRRHPELWRHEPRGTTTVATTTLDAWAEHGQSTPSTC